MSISNIDKIREKVEKLKKLADKMYDAAFNMTTDASLLRKAMDDYHQFTIYEYHKEELVSEELEKAAVEAFKQIVDDERNSFLEIFKAGAEWQFERVSEALLSEVLPCFMHGGEADEVVAKLDEVLNQKK